jgi:GT2 family glycosyltransferase
VGHRRECRLPRTSHPGQIPCFRQARYLADAIKTPLVQTAAAAEIIVVDDGSPNETSEMLQIAMPQGFRD